MARVSWRTAASFVLAAGIALFSSGKAASAPKPATHTVTIDAARYQPAALTITAGDSVVWVNKDLIPHTATSKTAGVFDSTVIAAGESWTYTPAKKGTSAYVCTFHPTMTGTLTVK